jgi:O-succinylbenzoic acid--CoA ligase
VAASAAATSARLEVDPAADVWLACLPLAHVGGLSVVTRALLTSTRLVVHDRFDAQAVITAAATLVALVPATLARVDASRFRRIVLGGSAPPTDRPSHVVATYGMTETGSGVVYDRVPLDGVQVAARDGEIHVRGPMLLRAYRDGTDPKDPDGWLPTGDGGTVDADGRLTVFGRLGDLIITGGENVWPVAVEAVLARQPGVAEVAVVGRPDPEWGQRVVAFVVPADPAAPPTLDALRAAVRDELAPWAAPKELDIVAALPRTAIGKVRRADL